MDSWRKSYCSHSKIMKITESAKEDRNFCGGSTIEILNDDILIEIFSYLSLTNRIRIERVCKKWKDLSKYSWSKVKKLEINPNFSGVNAFQANQKYPEIGEEIVNGVLRRCGKFLKEIVIKLDNLDCQLSTVAAYCPNIETIICENASIKGLEKLVENCKNISALHVDDSTSNNFNKFAFVNSFSTNKNIQVVNSKNYNGNYFH